MAMIIKSQLDFVREIEGEIKRKTLDQAVNHIMGKTRFRLIGIFHESFPELETLDAHGFMSRLGENRFDMGYEAMALLQALAMKYLDKSWERTYGRKNQPSSKHIGLPLVVAYEWLSKSFGAERPFMHRWWAKYNILMHQDNTLYQEPEKIRQLYAPGSESGYLDDGLMMLQLRSEDTLAAGRVRYNGSPVLSEAIAERIVDREMTDWIRMLIDEVGPEKAGRLAKTFCTEAERLRRLQRSFGEVDGGLGDYLQPWTQFEVCRIEIERYSRKAGLDLPLL